VLYDDDSDSFPPMNKAQHPREHNRIAALILNWEGCAACLLPAHKLRGCGGCVGLRRDGTRALQHAEEVDIGVEGGGGGGGGEAEGEPHEQFQFGRQKTQTSPRRQHIG
jgi:hypothetical protein